MPRKAKRNKGVPRTIVSEPDIYDWDAFLDNLPENVPTNLELRLTELEAVATEILRAADLPVGSRDDVSAVLADRAAPKSTKDQVHSQPWYADQLLSLTNVVRHWTAQKDAIRAADAGIELGLLVAKADFKITDRPDVGNSADDITGGERDKIESTKERGTTIRERNEVIIQKAIEKKRHDNALSASDIAKILSPASGLKSETIRKIIGPALRDMGI